MHDILNTLRRHLDFKQHSSVPQPGYAPQHPRLGTLSQKTAHLEGIATGNSDIQYHQFYRPLGGCSHGMPVECIERFTVSGVSHGVLE